MRLAPLSTCPLSAPFVLRPSLSHCLFADNIVHIVLARCENAPAGTKGISLFIVPKYLPKADGSIDTTGPKNLTCGGLEKKMGIHGSSTCVMNFEDSTGFLIGSENKGLHQVRDVVMVCQV